ncbi:MAG: ROK family protein [Polyangiales bacterium]|nr:ROK family protein [Sandaracinaceae bacterium]
MTGAGHDGGAGGVTGAGNDEAGGAAPGASAGARDGWGTVGASPEGRTLLAGDIGGTHTRLALFDGAGARVAHVDLESPRLAAQGTLEDAVALFLAHSGCGAPAAVALACAGPVRDGECRITNLPWVIREDTLSRATGAAHVRVINDFEAMARGTQVLRDDELEVLQAGRRDPSGACLVIGAGTGLGHAWLVPAGVSAPRSVADGATATHPSSSAHPLRVFASEGGHKSFAPRDGLEDGLLVWLRARHGRVSVERVLSGPGLVDLYTYLVESGHAVTSDSVHAAVAREGARAIGTRAAARDGDPACVLAVQRFASLYGAHTGDAALALLPTGGVYITGGVTAALVPALREHFLPAFLDKGRLRPALEPLWLAVALAPDTGLRGALEVARSVAGHGST